MTKILATLVTFITIVFSVSVLAAPPAEWGFKKLPAAMAEAKAANKPIFILFGFETCLGCKKLYRDALYDKELRETFQKNFVLAYVDTEKFGEPDSYSIGGRPAVSHADLMAEFKASPTPSWVWLTPNGARLYGDRGGRTTSRELLRDSEAVMEKFRVAAGS